MDEQQIFQEEALEVITDMEANILALREDLANQDLLGKIFRGLHTIKGSGAMFGFDRIATFTHKVEDTVDDIRQGKVEMTESLLDLLLSCCDHIHELLTNSDIESLPPEHEEIILASLMNYQPQEEDDVTDLSPRLNCWEHFKCGKEKECPAGVYTEFDGMNSGKCGGRICWIVSGTNCSNSVQGKYHEKFYERCKECEFRLLVKKQEGKNLANAVSVFQVLRKVAKKN